MLMIDPRKSFEELSTIPSYTSSMILKCGDSKFKQTNENHKLLFQIPNEVVIILATWSVLKTFQTQNVTNVFGRK